MNVENKSEKPLLRSEFTKDAGMEGTYNCSTNENFDPVNFYREKFVKTQFPELATIKLSRELVDDIISELSVLKYLPISSN